MQATVVGARIDEVLKRGEAAGVAGQVKTMTVVAYARQGEDELRLGKKPVEKQIERIKTFVRAQGWDLAGVYQDTGKAGEDLARPGLVELLAHPDFDVVVVDSTDRLACKKGCLDFLMAFFDRLGITCIAADWSWDYLSQYMRHHYRANGNRLYVLRDLTET